MSLASDCSHCHRQPEEGGPVLQRCGRCKVRSYCSRQCQKDDWPNHKKECRDLAGDDSDAIYYLKVSKPHFKDIDITGPYYPIEELTPRIRDRLRRENTGEGLRTFEKLLKTSSIDNIQRLKAQLPDGHTMQLSVTREHNPAVASLLRARKPKKAVPTYNVMTMSPSWEAFNDPESRKHVLVEEQDIFGTFTTKDEANQAARGLLERWKKERPGSVMDIGNHKDDMVAGAVLPTTGKPLMLQVNLDYSKKGKT